MAHKCNRDDCDRTNVNGPKMKCAKCQNVCYLMCFGFEKSATMDSIDVIKHSVPNGGTFYKFLPNSVFICCAESITTAELKANLKVPAKARGTSQTRQQKTENASIINEISEIKEKMNKLSETTEKNTIELVEIKTTVSENNVLCKALDSKANACSTSAHTQSITNTPSFARLTADNRLKLTPKRKLDKGNEPKKLIEKLPKPVNGTRDINIGPPPITKEKSNANTTRNTKPKFAKSIWISGLAPATTNEEMTTFVLKSIGSEDSNQFNCHKLVKKRC